jgi:hypothetical protein
MSEQQCQSSSIIPTNNNNFDKWLIDSIMQYAIQEKCHNTHHHLNHCTGDPNPVLTPDLIERIFVYSRDVSSTVDNAKCRFLPKVGIYEGMCMITFSCSVNQSTQWFLSREIVSQVNWFRFCTLVKPCDDIVLDNIVLDVQDSKICRSSTTRSLHVLYDKCELDPYTIYTLQTLDGRLIPDKEIILRVLQGSIRVVKSKKIRMCSVSPTCEDVGVHYACYNNMYQWACNNHKLSDTITPHPCIKNGGKVYVVRDRADFTNDEDYYQNQMFIEAEAEAAIKTSLMLKAAREGTLILRTGENTQEDD